MSWLGLNRSKTQFNVWYMGTSESDGLRGDEYCIPKVRQMLRNCNKRLPNKVTLQISQKGMKLTQTTASVSKSGRLKNETVKLHIPTHSITYSTIAPQPLNDVVACIMVIQRADSNTPVHIHCYRCDTSDTALQLHVAIQTLLNRTEQQKRISEMERRLAIAGLIRPLTHGGIQRARPTPAPLIYPQSDFLASRHHERQPLHEDTVDYLSSSDDGVQQRQQRNPSVERARRLQSDLLVELKGHLKANQPVIQTSSSLYSGTKSYMRPTSLDRHAHTHATSSSGVSSDMSAPDTPPRHVHNHYEAAQQRHTRDASALRRFSIADIQNAWMIDDQIMSSPVQSDIITSNARRYQKAHEQRMAVRMFGDTIVQKNAHGPERPKLSLFNFTKTTAAPAPPPPKQDLKAWRSLDNLLLTTKTPQATPTNLLMPERVLLRNHIPRQQHPATAWTPYDRFWRDRARRASAFVPAF